MDNNNVYYNPNSQQEMSAPITAVKQEEKTLKFEKRDYIFAAIFAVISFVIVDFIMLHGLNFGFTLAFYALFAATTAYLFKKSNNISVFSCICGALSLAGAASFTVYHDYFINFIMLLIVCGLFAIYTCGLSNTFAHREGSYKIAGDITSGIFVKPFSYISEISSGLVNGISKGSSLKNALIGIAVAIPVLIVIVPLLIKSDEAFGGLVELVAKNIGIYLVELLVAAFVFAYIIMYFICKKERLGIKKAKKSSYKGFVAEIASISFLSVISFVYVVYLLSQFAYFFSAFSGILPEGYELTESEFARRGFFEMFAICAINMVLITAVTIFTKKTHSRLIAVKCIASFIMLFTVLLLITAMAKMKMNIGIYGLSKNRIMVCIFMIMMLVSIFFYILHIFKPKFSYMQSIVVICSALFIALAFCNLDARIAQYNIKAYEEGRISLDVDYIAELSESAAPYLIELADSDDKSISLKAKYGIYNNILYDNPLEFGRYEGADNLILTPTTDFREFNIARHKAQLAYVDYYNSLSKKEKKYFNTTLEWDYNSQYGENEDYYEYE